MPDVVDFALNVTGQLQALGPVQGPVAYALFLAVWIVLCLPCTPIEIIPGFVFGFRTGWLVSLAGKSLGSLASMLLGRFVFRGPVERFVFKRFPVMKKLGLAIEKEGFGALLLIRGMMLPMAVKNYGLSVLRGVSLRDSLFAGFLTALPHSFVWALIGSNAQNLAEVVHGEASIQSVLPGPLICAVMLPLAFFAAKVSRSIYARFNLLMDKVERASG
jgi:uncharacterized membrane protein YdjX (TVP38/TMEM64 family)